MARPAQHLPEALIFEEVKGPVASVVNARDDHRPAAGQAEFVADERRYPPRLRQGAVVEEITRIQRRITKKLEQRSMENIGSRLGNDVGSNTEVIPVPTIAEGAGRDTTAFPGDTLIVPVNPRWRN